MTAPTTTPGDPLGATTVAAVQRRTVAVLVLTQAVGAVGITIGIATASLLARDISGSDGQAGLAQTFQVLGAALASYVLARVMAMRGRRLGLTTGYLLGACGAVLAVVAGTIDSMVVLLLGAVLLGSTTAANNAARYAATDLAEPAQRGRALAIVVWATTIGAVAGPNLTGPAAALARWLGLPELTGPFALGSIGMLLAAALVSTLLRPDPLLLAREVAGTAGQVPSGTSWGRVVAAVRERPVLVAAVVGLAGAHAAMVAVMVMTPLHMEHGGAELRIIGVVISVHVLGMFAFAPVVGWLADTLGRPVTLGTGGVVLVVALVIAGSAPEGSSWQIFGGLFLLGLGWSFATVAASTLVADHAPLDARADVQGAADLVMNLVAAAGGGLAGVVVALAGYRALSLGTVALGLAVLAAAVAAHRLTPVAAAEHPGHLTE
ncbi:Major Facilitator Superfamily protein [Nocardioides dokdonensis FR1436]|uniref:Major Facilitator Superfamily protein n=1 Tax=Nocardioides dokdonensis FR1436 TaxID=1300347 RepID=A0A1A9GM14_9ACTN|nr:MFS transporter [Nocardioides dokdonensis]ANH39329.1 Major Facilitator Superfamily protein [Nocardioides dokdonensis FR1436]